MVWQYIKEVLGAFMTLMISSSLMMIMLVLLRYHGAIVFETDQTSDLLPLMISMLLVTLYLLMLMAATPGYAQGAIMPGALPFNRILK